MQGFAGDVVGVAHDEDVGRAAEGVRVECLRFDDDFGLRAWGLAAGRAVVVPVGERLESFGGCGEDAGFGAGFGEAVYPDVFGYAVGDGKVEKCLDGRHFGDVESVEKVGSVENVESAELCGKRFRTAGCEVGVRDV